MESRTVVEQCVIVVGVRRRIVTKLVREVMNPPPLPAALSVNIVGKSIVGRKELTNDRSYCCRLIDGLSKDPLKVFQFSSDVHAAV